MGHIPSMVLDVDQDLRLALRAGPMRLMHKRRGTMFSEVLVCRTRLPHEEGAQPSLTGALHRSVLSPPDYPAGQPHERSTSFQGSQVGAWSTPWSAARDRRNRRAP